MADLLMTISDSESDQGNTAATPPPQFALPKAKKPNVPKKKDKRREKKTKAKQDIKNPEENENIAIEAGFNMMQDQSLLKDVSKILGKTSEYDNTQAQTNSWNYLDKLTEKGGDTDK